MNDINGDKTVPRLPINGVSYATIAEKAKLVVELFAEVSSDENYTDEFQRQNTTLQRSASTLFSGQLR